MVSILMLNSHISEVFLTTVSDMEASSDDTRTELDYRANMVVLVSNSFVFESSGRTHNTQPFSSGLGMEKDIPIVDRSLACDCPCTG